MAHPYKLTYFNLRGRAEIIRMIFALAEVEYEDVRVTREHFAETNSKLPNGQFPVMEIDGKIFCQSHAIAKYLANEFGIGGKTGLEKLKADMVVDLMNDFIQPLIKVFITNNDNKKSEVKKKYAEEQAPQMLSNLEKLVEDSGFMAGDSLTYADLAVLVYTEFATSDMMGISIDFSKYPKLQGVMEKAKTNPKIDAWMKKRPESAI